MKKKTIKSKLNLNKSVISKFNASKIKGGGTRHCQGGGGPTTGTRNCHNTGTAVGCAPETIGCPIT